MCKLYLCNIRPWCAHVRDTWQQTCLKRNSNAQCAMGHLDNKWEMRLDETWVDISTWDNLLHLSLEAEKHSGWWGLWVTSGKHYYDFLIGQQLLWKYWLILDIMAIMTSHKSFFFENLAFRYRWRWWNKEQSRQNLCHVMSCLHLYLLSFFELVTIKFCLSY